MNGPALARKIFFVAAIILGVSALTPFLVSTAHAEPLACADLFASPVVRPKFLSDLVDEELVRIGRPPLSKPRPIARFREWLALRTLNVSALKNPDYLERFAERLADLKVRESLAPLDDLELKPAERKSLEALFWRSVVYNGLRSYAERGVGPTNPTAVFKLKTQALSSLISLLQSPAYRFLTQLEIPNRRVFLTRDQLRALLTEGLQSPEVDALLKTEARAGRLAQFNHSVSRLMKFGFIATSAWWSVPEALRAYDQGVERSTAEFKQSVAQETASPGDLALQLARQNVHEVIESFEARYREKPRPEELKAIRDSICVKEFGSILSSSEQKACAQAL